MDVLRAIGNTSLVRLRSIGPRNGDEFVRANEKRILGELDALLRIPSISTDSAHAKQRRPVRAGRLIRSRAPGVAVATSTSTARCQ